MKKEKGKKRVTFLTSYPHDERFGKSLVKSKSSQIRNPRYLCLAFTKNWIDFKMIAAVNLFDAAALDIFFEDAGSMGLSNRTRLQLAHEGIADPEDFKEFD